MTQLIMTYLVCFLSTVMARSQLSEYRVLLIGSSGTGKSTFGNFILNDTKIFDTEVSFGAVTGKARLAHAIVDHDSVYVIDTPGLCEASELLRDNDGLREMTQALVFAAWKGGVNAIVYLMSPADRFLQFQQCVLEYFESAQPELSDLFWSSFILVFSHASSLGRDKQKQDQYIQNTLQKPHCPSSFQWLMGKVNKKYVLFEDENNSPEYRQALRKEFMQLVRQSGRQRYQNNLMERIAHELLTPVNWRAITLVCEVFARAVRLLTTQPDEPIELTETELPGTIRELSIEDVLPQNHQLDEAVVYLKQKLQHALREKEGCFPGESKIVTSEGIKKMKDLTLKDKVLCLKADRKIAFTKIMTFLHYEQCRPFWYLHLQTEEGSSLSISPCHLIFKANKMGETYVFASEIEAGDYVLSISSSTQQLEKVKSVTSYVSNGVFAPLTENGTLVVDGIYVSCYAHTKCHTRAHNAFLPLRILAKVGHYCPRNGIHKYASFLKTVKDLV